MTPKLTSLLPLHKRNVSNTDTQHSRTELLPNSGPTKKWTNDLMAGLAEFAGTFMFLFFSFGGTQLANSTAEVLNRDNSVAPVPNTGVLLYTALSFGFSLMVNVWIFFRISGGLFNPSVSLGLYLIGAITARRAMVCFIAQMLGGMAAAGVVSAMFPGSLDVSTTLNNMTKAQGVFLEMFLTALLVFTIFMLAAEKHKATHLAPIGIGLAFFVAELVGLFYTGGSLNPARSFGPCVVTRSFPGYHYIYWLGPLMGTLLAFAFYKLFKIVDYHSINPGQDFDDHETAYFHPSVQSSSAENFARPNVSALVASEVKQVLSRITPAGSHPSNGEFYRESSPQDQRTVPVGNQSHPSPDEKGVNTDKEAK